MVMQGIISLSLYIYIYIDFFVTTKKEKIARTQFNKANNEWKHNHYHLATDIYYFKAYSIYKKLV